MRSGRAIWRGRMEDGEMAEPDVHEQRYSTPMTYWVVGTLKRKEGVDDYDRDTHFSPFLVKE